MEFTYESHKAASSCKSSVCGFSSGDFKSAIARLSRNAVKELRNAIELSDMDCMTQVVAEIGVGHCTLANELKKLVDTFQFDRLFAFFDETEDISSQYLGEKT